MNFVSNLTFLLIATPLLMAKPSSAEPIPVRYIEGTVHGFAVLRDSAGKTLASGDLIQILHGDRVVSRALFRFKDGSVDDETSEFTQRGEFRLISDHLIQKGPQFPHPLDVLIDAKTGRVTVRSTDNGKEKRDTEHLDLPPDLVNGIILNVLKNIRSDTPRTTVSYVAAASKPRLAKLSITPEGEETFSVGGARHKAMRFLLKVELGGITGIIAPLIGKDPPDVHVWVTDGDAPAFVRLAGPLYMGGPVWNIEVASPVWPESPNAHP